MIRIENVTILKVMTFFVLYRKLLRNVPIKVKNAPRGCDQMHVEYVC